VPKLFEGPRRLKTSMTENGCQRECFIRVGVFEFSPEQSAAVYSELSRAQLLEGFRSG
jgi:hypothetical protein